MTGLELIFDFFEDHIKAAAHIQDSRPLALGVFCFFIGSVGQFVARAMTHWFFFLPFSWTSLAMNLIWGLFVGLVMTAILHLAMDFTGSKGNASSLFVLLGLASTAWGLAVPLLLIERLLFAGSAWAVGLTFVGVGLLSLSLKARCLQDNYKVTVGKSVLMLSVPYLAGAAVGGALAFLAMAQLFLQLIKSMH